WVAWPSRRSTPSAARAATSTCRPVSSSRSGRHRPASWPTARSAGGSSSSDAFAVMLLWFLGSALGAVWLVFRDRRFDVRLLAVGAVLPELDVVFGGARVMHSLVFSLVLLAVVMAATFGRRPARKLWLGLPIGTMLHLV